MTAKRILFRSAAREKVLRGATQLADAVRITLGPKLIDSVKIVRTALENAVSVASILLLTEATMTERPEKPKEPASAEPDL